MKNIIANIIAISVLALGAQSVSASAEGRTIERAPIVSTGTFQVKPTTTTQPFDNTAKAWTSACYAEFGPNATHPDAAMLEKCLNWGS